MDLLLFGATASDITGDGESIVIVLSEGVGPGVITQVDPSAQVLLPAITSSGDGVTGVVGSDGTAGDDNNIRNVIAVRASGTGAWGGLGLSAVDSGDPNGWTNIRVKGKGVGLWGGIAEFSQIVFVRSEGDGSWGGFGEPGVASRIVVRTIATAPEATNLVGSGESLIYVISSPGSGYVDAITGSGVSLVYVISEPGTTNITGEISGELHWHVFPVNISNFAPTEHDTPFSSMVKIGDNIYATGPTGIHLIGRDNDAESPIVSILTKGPSDFGTRKIKIMTDMYMRGIFNGAIEVEIWGDHGHGSVAADDGVTRVHGAKVDLPRGVYGSELTYSIKNVDGKYFEITEIEYLLSISEVRRARQTSG